ncbi:Antibiotic biosynthesis monooxygenase [Aliiroseovarius crassostreae]|uniref:Antibiotic biosynthesis monooxygenase n=1 Tax=Aliiroseovarius crassostreae TaxID=154981 RepID=A0A0P7I0T1_9RHOB|nr:antibiotic biosynthesis monooxygenase [Aliiroseovarius crassostreae]KPN62444.1 antibiotic biosynthesis monooxygenase [Aliiroseovarius crassostreae]SFU85584.1 Antibiotic biosynthesis monooxygenase [Aliiroseovarius crassostreae]
MTKQIQISLTGYIDVPEDRLAAVAAALPAHIALTRAELGCVAFDVTMDEDIPGRFNVTERFASRVDFEAHQQRMRASPWAEITAGIPRHYQITETPG